jgi:hypothetical protein
MNYVGIPYSVSLTFLRSLQIAKTPKMAKNRGHYSHEQLTITLLVGITNCKNAKMAKNGQKPWSLFARPTYDHT